MLSELRVTCRGAGRQRLQMRRQQGFRGDARAADAVPDHGAPLLADRHLAGPREAPHLRHNTLQTNAWIDADTGRRNF